MLRAVALELLGACLRHSDLGAGTDVRLNFHPASAPHGQSESDGSGAGEQPRQRFRRELCRREVSGREGRADRLSELGNEGRSRGIVPESSRRN